MTCEIHKDVELVSTCCFARLINEDICSKCKDHAEGECPTCEEE